MTNVLCKICPYEICIGLSLSKEVFSIKRLTAHCICGKQTCLLTSKKGLGTNASKSILCELTGDNGLAFIVCSTIDVAVERRISVTNPSPTLYLAFLQLLTNRSHSPWECIASVGSDLSKIYAISSLFRDTRYGSFLFRSNKIYPLLLTIARGLPLRAISFMRQLSVPILVTTSICTTLAVRQKNRQRHLFSFAQSYQSKVRSGRLQY